MKLYLLCYKDRAKSHWLFSGKTTSESHAKHWVAIAPHREIRTYKCVNLKMDPVWQTRHGKYGNCMAACVATLLDKAIDEVDVPYDPGDENKFDLVINRMEQKAGCKIYGFPYQAITDRVVTTQETFCIVSVCSSVRDNALHHPESMWHAVVCKIANDGTLSLVHNPDAKDPRKSLDQFAAMSNLWLVTKNSTWDENK